MREILLEKITQLQQSYIDFDKIYRDKDTRVKEQKAKLSNITSVENIPSYDEIEEFYINSYVDLIAYSQDLQLLFMRFGHYCDLFVEVTSEEVPAQFTELYKVYKSLIRPTFVMKNGNLSEVEEGSLDKKREEFLNGEIYQNLKKKFS